MTEAEVRAEMMKQGPITCIEYLVQMGEVEDIMTALDMDKTVIFDMATKAKIKELEGTGVFDKQAEASEETPAVEETVVQEQEEAAADVEETVPEEETSDQYEDEDPTQDETTDDDGEENAQEASRPQRRGTRRERPQRMTAAAAWDMFSDVLDAIQGMGSGAPPSGQVVVDNTAVVEAVRGLTSAVEALQAHITVLTERIEAVEGELTGIESNGLSQILDSIDSVGKQVDRIEEISTADTDILKGYIQDAGVHRESVGRLLEFIGNVGPGGEYILLKSDMMRQLITAASGNFQALKKEEV